MKKVNILFILFIFFALQSKMLAQTTTKQDVIRFDSELYKYINDRTVEKEKSLKSNFATLITTLSETINQDRDDNVATSLTHLTSYFSHPRLLAVYKESQKRFADISDIETDLKAMKQYMDAYLPNHRLPQLVFHVSGFKENTILVDNLISVSVDRYLGSNYELYKEFFQPYQRQQMERKHILRDYLKAWMLSDVLSKKKENQTLLSTLINEGKVLYVQSKLLPQYNESDLMGYTETQLEWAQKNEKSEWRKIVKNNQLYSKDYMLISKYTNEAPNQTLLGKDVPERMICWLGLQIIKEYVAKNNTAIDVLLKMDNQAIFNASGYKP